MDADIDPLPGNVNPFRVGADRTATNRKYKVVYNLAIGDPVALNGQAHIPLYRGAGNTRTGALIVYRGPLGKHDAFLGNAISNPSRFNYGSIWVRTYAPDKGKDARGGVALPKIYCELSTGEQYFIACDHSVAKKNTDVSTKMRVTKTAGLGNYATAYSEWGKEFGIYRSILSGVCKSQGWYSKDSIQRVREIDLGATGRGEFQPAPGNYAASATTNNYATYLSHGVQLDSNMIAVVVGKLPTFPDTRNGLKNMTAAEIRYFSMGAYDDDPLGPSPGALINCIMDDELILDNDRNYIIAYSRKADKPTNASTQNGIKWVEWGSIADLALTARFVTVGPEWEFEKSPHEKHLPWAKADFAGSAYDSTLLQNSHKGWMACYLPQLHMMTKQEFEQLGNSIKADDIPVWIDTKNVLGYNDSQNHPSMASSEENTTHPSSAAFDGNLNTRWSSVWSGDPQWLSVDLGTVKKISGVKLYWEFTLKASTFEIQISTNNSTWTSVYSTTTGDGGIDIINNLKVSARYVRVRASAGTLPMYSLMEMEVFSPEMQCGNLPTSVSSNTVEKKGLKIWPNPATSSVIVELPFLNNSISELSMVDLRGRILYKKDVTGSMTEINIDDVPNGTYFMKLRAGGINYSQKFLKVK